VRTITEILSPCSSFETGIAIERRKCSEVYLILYCLLRTVTQNKVNGTWVGDIHIYNFN
jgi:hypothetical protein